MTVTIHHRARLAGPRLLLSSGVLASALAATACGGSSSLSAQPAQAPPPTEVGVVTLAPRTVPVTVELPGRTAAYLTAEVRPQVTGILEERLFREGVDVRAGQGLYRIDSAPYAAAVDNAQAALVRAKANLQVARLKADRYRELVTIDAVSKQNNDDAQAALAQAEADVAGAEAALKSARINLGFTQVKAPISGRIGRSATTVGALVTAGQPDALSKIQQLDPIYVDVTQASAEMLRLRRDLESGRLARAGKASAVVKLLLEDGTPYARTGQLQFSEMTVDATTGSVTLRAVFPNPTHELLPGMYVRAVIEEGVADDAILVPQAGVQRDTTGKPIAYVVDAQQQVAIRPLELRRTVGSDWLVDSGLQAGDKVIVEGLQKVRPGVRVQAKPVTAPASSPTPATAAGK